MRRSSRVFHVEHLQCVVFCLTHGGGVFWRFVLEPGQMKHPMRHHAPELFLKHNTMIFSVFRTRSKEIKRSPDRVVPSVWSNVMMSV